MAEGFRFMSLGLVRLRTSHGLVRCNINTCVHARAHIGRVIQRCHNCPDGKQRLASARVRAEHFGWFWKSQLAEKRPSSGEDGWFSLARWDLCGGCHTCWWGDRWKSQNRKIVPLPLYDEKPLNSKVIKGFVPELRSRYVFFEFRDSYILSSWTLDVRFTHCHIMVMVEFYLHLNKYNASLAHYLVANLFLYGFNLKKNRVNTLLHIYYQKYDVGFFKFCIEIESLFIYFLCYFKKNSRQSKRQIR